jgi:hypothetical protein
MTQECQPAWALLPKQSLLPSVLSILHGSTITRYLTSNTEFWIKSFLHALELTALQHLKASGKNVDSICQSHIYARPVQSKNKILTGEWRIITFNGVHTCSNNQNKQQRQYKYSLLDSISPPLAGYLPNRKKALVQCSSSRILHIFLVEFT